MIVVAIVGLLSAIVMPNYVRARQQALTNTCIANLKQIHGAVQVWAMDFSVSSDAVPGATSDLAPYIKTWPYCGSTANTYEMPAVNADPVCPVVANRVTHHL